jgi:hypothetical protein
MKTRFASLLLLVVLAPVARGEEVWRWTDAAGTVHYSNRADAVAPDAVPVKTRLIVEATSLPGAPDVADEVTTVDARSPHIGPRAARKRVHRIYTEERLRFGCFAGSLLYAGGWSHPDDINAQGNCLPYLLGPEAWLNAARAELGLREHGIDWRQIVPIYTAVEREFAVPRRVTTVNTVD